MPMCLVVFDVPDNIDMYRVVYIVYIAMDVVIGIESYYVFFVVSYSY